MSKTDVIRFKLILVFIGGLLGVQIGLSFGSMNIQAAQLDTIIAHQTCPVAESVEEKEDD
jgi:hypothetical protein